MPLIAGLAGVLVLTGMAFGGEPVRPVRRNLQVEDFGTILRARTVTGEVLYREPKSGHLHFNCSLEACNGLTAEDGALGAEAPFQIFDLDLETGEGHIVTGRQGRTFVPFKHSNGKLYFMTSRPPALLEYDPATGRARDLGLLQKDNYYAGVQSRMEGPDGRIYMGMYGLHLTVYDPATDKVEDLGDASNGNCKNGYVYEIAVDEHYIRGRLTGYGATGYCVYDLKARKNYYFTDEEYAAALRTGIWKHGEEQVFIDNPPKRVPFSPYRALGHEMWHANSAEMKRLGLEMDLTDLRPTDWNGGLVTVRWRRLGEEKWRVSQTKGADLIPNSIKRLTALPDGRLIGMSAFYGLIFTYDPATRQAAMLGPSPGSVYDMLVVGNTVYFSGYSAMFAVYDLTRPWTYFKEDQRGKNPNYLVGGGKYNYYMAAGADGRIYIAGHHERHTTGAELSCYDPAEPGKLKQLLRKDLMEHSPTDLVAINGGRTMVMGYGRQLVVCDTERPQAARRVDLPEPIPNAGKLLDAGPDHVAGLVQVQQKGEPEATEHGVLYRINVKTGEVLYIKTIPGKVFSGQLRMEFKGGDARFAQGPDGCGWLFIDKWLARINPQDGTVEKIMEMDKRGRMFFVGDDLYIYNGGRQYFGGFAGILRIRNVFE